jgi:putative transposase
MRFRLIEDHRDIWPVRVMCEALSVSPSGYYAWRSRPDSPRKIANRALLVDIRRVHAQHRERYGAPRIYAQLRAEGQTVSRKRVERVMRQHGLRARTPRRYRVCTTDSIARRPAMQPLRARVKAAFRAAQLNKLTYSVTQLGGFSPPLPVVAITANDYGYVTVTQKAATGGSGFSVYGPNGMLQEDGGGAPFISNTTNAYLP